MKAIIEVDNQKIQVGLKCDPNACPRCGERLVRERIDPGLDRIWCTNQDRDQCRGYEARERIESLKMVHEYQRHLERLGYQDGTFDYHG